MGKVIFSALVDAWRPIMVNGISRTFKDGIGTFVSNNAVYAKALQEVEYFDTYYGSSISIIKKKIY